MATEISTSRLRARQPDGGRSAGASASRGAGGWPPRPRAARPGSVADAARPRRELTWSGRTRAGRRGEKAAGRPRRTPAGPSPFSNLRLAGRWEAATAAQPARDALLEEEGIPGRPHPAASLSPPPLAAGPAPPLPTGAAARRAGVAATCARPLTGTRAPPPAWSAFRRGSSARGPRAAGRPRPSGACRPNMAAGAGRAPEGACGESGTGPWLPACPRADYRSRRSGAPPGSRKTARGAGLCFGRGSGFFGTRLSARVSALCLRTLCR